MASNPDIRAELEKAWRLATAPLRMMPAFIIAGAPKCGTSTLYDMIAAHPKVRRASRKEPTNFVHYPGSRLRSAMHYPFRLGNRGCITGEGSVEYFTHPDAPANVREIVPDARLIFLLREPVKRAWSDYQMFRKHGTETAGFGERVSQAVEWLKAPSLKPLVAAAARRAFNPVRYVHAGMYAAHIETWHASFPREQCLVLFSEELFADRANQSGEILRHLGLSGSSLPETNIAREGGYSESMPREEAELLRNFYAGENEKLADLLGRKLPW